MIYPGFVYHLYFSTQCQHLLFKDGCVLGNRYHIVGIAHYLFHTSCWAQKVCYLQDLFTAHDLRGKGVARALIEAVAADARKQGAARYYWMTQEHNATARLLYDKVAKWNGFIRYEHPL